MLTVLALRPVERFKGVIFLLVFFSIWMGLNFIEEISNSTNYYLITPSFNLLLGPMIYFMVNDIVGAKFINRVRILKHITPAIISLFFSHIVELVVALGSISQLFYLVHSYKLLHRYDMAIVNSTSNADSLKLQWLETISIFIFSFMLIDMIRLNIKSIISTEIYYFWYLTDITILLGICCFLFIKSVRQTELFDGLQEYEGNNKSSNESEELNSTNDSKYTELIDKVFQEVNHHVITLGLYKTPKLTIQQVAEVTGFNTKDTSQAINEIANKNFNDYINSLRINAFKEKVKVQGIRNNSLLDIALECGFNSKSTFNLAFKKLEGKTPTQYLKQLSF